METGIDIALLIGILLNLTKGGDLILLKSQKKWIQAKFENFTIWLDDVKPIQWFKVFTTQKGLRILIFIGVIYMIYFMVIFLRRSSDDQLPFTIFIMSVLIGLIILPFIRTKRVLRIIEWLVKDKNSLKFILRYFIVLFGGMILFSIYAIFINSIFWAISSEPNIVNNLDKALYEFNSKNGIVYLAAFVLIWPAFIFYYVLIFVFGLLMNITVGIWIIELIVKIIKAITWRIVEYNKGVFSAIILIVTIVLGIYKLNI